MTGSDPIIVYPVKQLGSRWKNNELRYSLRSIDENWWQQGGARVFVLTTEKIDWLQNCDVIPVKRYCETIVRAIGLAKEHSQTGDYVWMNDDIMFLKATSPADLGVALHIGRLSSPYEPTLPANGWRRKLHRVRDDLADFGMENYNFSAHTPYLFNADMMEKTIARFGLEYKLPLETAYYNMWSERVPSRRCREKISIHEPKPVPASVGDKRFLNIADAGLTNEAKAWIQGLFPHPSIYEK